MRIASLTFALLLASACAPQSGNYASLKEAETNKIAEDTVKKLVILHPPASTRILLSQAPNDAYGEVLEKRLRESGYAIQASDGIGDWLATLSKQEADVAPRLDAEAAEYHSSGATQQAAPVLPVEVGVGSAAQTTSIPLSYIVDPIDGGLYRVVVAADSQVLSRVYRVSNKQLVAAGAWTLKE